MSELFAALAALIPVIAGLLVACAALVRNARAKKEFKVRSEIEGAYQRARTRVLMDEPVSPAIPDFYSSGLEHQRWIRDNALEREGLTPAPDSSEVSALNSMTEQPLSKAQIRDQWVLICASAAGVVFLALSILMNPYAASA